MAESLVPAATLLLNYFTVMVENFTTGETAFELVNTAITFANGDVEAGEDRMVDEFVHDPEFQEVTFGNLLVHYLIMFLRNLFHYKRFHQLKDFEFMIIFFYLDVTLVGYNLSFSITQSLISISKLLLFHLLNNFMFPHLLLQHV